VTQTRIPTDADLFSLPPGLPAPVDDGSASHLVGRRVPGVLLRSTRGRTVDVSEAARTLSVFYLYPATVRPGIPIPGEWSEVPGARGCTVQNCGYRDRFDEFRALQCEVFGVSGQGQDAELGLAEQIEFAARVRLPFELLNDSDFQLTRALGLPTFLASLRSPRTVFEGKEWTFPLQGRTLVRRLAFVAEHGLIEQVFYPVFPPDLNASTVLDYLKGRPARLPSARRD
jgi:peroxiredoxin